MEVILREFTLQLKHTFRISRESRDSQQTLIVELKDKQTSGFGEATANLYYGVSIEEMKDAILAIPKDIFENTTRSPSEFYQEIYPYLRHNMFALCGLDMAYTDFYARSKGMKLYEYWGLDIQNNPKTNYTIGIDTIEKMVLKLQEQPWPIYKIKLGTKDDIKIIKELRTHTTANFRVDANCGWTVDETIANAKAFKELRVEFIEQPLKADDWEGHKKVFSQAILPIIADESCLVETDVAKCHEHFHGINVKLMKCGGLTPGKRMLEQAKEFGMKTMVGCMTESSIGISAIAHLLPLLNYVDMDGPLLITNDIAKGVTFDDGVIHYSNKNGIGTVLL